MLFTITFLLKPLSLAVAAVSSALRTVMSLFDPAGRPVRASDVLKRAEQYKATQPSYAADLRAAARAPE
jgi:hypothetical protein